MHKKKLGPTTKATSQFIKIVLSHFARYFGKTSLTDLCNKMIISGPILCPTLANSTPCKINQIVNPPLYIAKS